ncbi:MAG: response regulator [Brachymonas sp.]|nr:response regulator [Brachymonas sp.]
MINQDKLPPPANSQASTPANLDLGPLAWVVDSLRDTLQSVREQLIAFSQEVEAASGSHLTTLDTAALRMAAQSLHEAVGVLDLVERPAAAKMVGAMERCTQLFIANPELCVPSAAQTVAQAGTAVLDYLSRLLKGQPDFSPGLFPAYRDVAKLAGIDRIHPADLWHGPWQWLEVEERAQPPASDTPSDAAGMLPFLEGVLHMLRSGGEQGVRQLAAHAQRLERQSAHTKERVFWQLLGGLLQLQSAHTLRFDDQLKRLLSQVAVQYDLLQQPSGQVSERLAQDLLYFIALGHSKKPAATATPLASAIVERYQLDRVAISDYDQLLYGTVDPALRSQLRENIATFKELWADVSSDNTHKIQPLAALAKDLTRNLNVLWPAASPFSEVLQAIITHIGETGHAPHPGVAMEVATAILFLEASAEEHSGDDSLFEGRIALLAQRLEAVRQSGQMEAPTEWMEALYARLNDQDSLAQVVAEARSTIGEVEQALDDFFRHPQKTQQASDSIDKLGKIAGVLLALNYEEVSQAITVMAQQIRQLVDASEQTGSIDAPDEQQVVLKLGNSLGALSFMLDMMIYQPEQARAQFHFDEAAQELTHRNALVHTPVHAASAGKAAAPGTGTTSTQLGQTHIPALNDLLNAQATGNLSSATAIEQLGQLTLQAELAGQPALAQRTRQALDSIQTADTENPEALAQAISSLTPPAAAPALPEDGIVDTPIEEEDLRDIFLEEAAEVIGNALTAIESLHNHPADTAQLTNLRRAFHTLKGSGRMVGLASFGEAAWELERTLNGWLADAKPATQPLLQLATNALEALTEWRESIARQEKTRWHHAYFSPPAAAMQEDGRFLPIAIPGEAPIPSTLSALPEANAISDATVFAADTAVIAETIIPASDALSSDADDLLFAPETTTAAKAGPTAEPPMEKAAPVFAAEATPADEASEPVIESALFADEPPALIDETPAADETPADEADDWLFAPETAEEALAETAATPAIEEAEPLFAAEDTAPADSGQAALADEATLLAAIAESPASAPTHTAEADEPALFANEADAADEPLALINDAATISPAVAPDARDAGTAASDAPMLELSALPNVLSLELPPLEATPTSDTATTSDEPSPFADEEIDASAAPAETAAPEIAPAPALSLEQFLSELPSLDLAPSAVASSQSPATSTQAEESPFAQEDETAPAEAAAIAAAADEVLFADEAADATTTAASPDAPLLRLPIVGAAPEASGSALQTAAAPTPPPATDHSTDTDSPIHKALLDMLVDTTPQQAVLQDMVDGLPDEEIKHVGDMRIPLALFNAYLNEADVWSRQLVQELSEWVLASHKPVPHVCEQLAHSLAGSSAAVGMGGLASMARGIEHAIERLAQRSARNDEAHALHHAAEVVRQELHQFAAGIYHPVNHALLCKLAAIVENVPLDKAVSFCPTDTAPPAKPAGIEKKNVEGLAAPTGPAALATAADTAAPDQAATADESPDAAEPPAADAVAAAKADADASTASDAEPCAAGKAAPVTASAAPAARTADGATDKTHKARASEPAAQPDARATEPTAPAEKTVLVQAAAPATAPALATCDNTPDAIDPELFDIFREEAQTLLPQLNAVMRQWVAHPDNGGARTEAQRLLHTFKGGARLAGAMQLGAMVHDMESAISDLGTLGKNSESVQALEQLQAMLDEVDEHFTRLLHGETGTIETDAASTPSPGSDGAPASPSAAADTSAATAVAALASASSIEAAAARTAPAADSASQPAGSGAVAALPAPAAPAASQAAASQLQHVVAMPVVTHAPAHTVMQPQVRVRSQVLDRMLGSTGEVMISRARLEAEVQQLRQAMQDMDGSLDRLRAQLRDMELQAETQMQSRMAQAAENAANFDPLEFDRFTRVQELTRMMAESVNDVASVQRTMVRTVQASEDNLIAQARQARELQDDLLRSRMVEFDSLSERLYRVVRQAAKESGKQVTLNISGAQTAMDRTIIERIASPFEHLLRNAVVHGIESPEQRAQAGKEAVGHIEISLQQDGNDVAISVRDDGKGLNVPRIREKAIANKLLAPDAQISDDEAMQLIFQSGLSTADQVTSLAGRGVGMDVVRTEVKALGGRIETRSRPQAGTEFTLVLPLTTAVTQVVEVQAGDLRFGVPSGLIESVQRASSKEIQQAYNAHSYTFHGESLPFYWAGAMLQASRRSANVSAKRHVVLILRSAAQRIVMHVDAVVGNHEVVVKNIGPQLARMPGLSGITILPNGSALLIYNPVALSFVYEEQIRAFSADRADPAVLGRSVKLAEPLAPLVLVVDDSITVRRVTGRLLQREGYRVASAANGVAALRAIANERPDLVLSDIEMPQMDGFDLLRNIRSSDELKDLPVIMITSRTADKHRDHAMELGATGFLGKPYPEEAMLELLRQHARAPAAKA